MAELLLLKRERLLNFTLTLIASFFLVTTGWGSTDTTAVANPYAYSQKGLVNPTVTSDKDDYAPGEIAIITGTGWTLDSTVDIHLEEEPAHDHHHGYHGTVVDANGNWRIEYPIEERHLGVKFTVVVDGVQSKYQGLAYFTDGKIAFSTTGLPQGIPITVTFDPPQGNSNVREFTSPGPSADVTVNTTNFTYSYPSSVFTEGGVEYVFVSSNFGNLIADTQGNQQFGVNAVFELACKAPSIAAASQPANQLIAYGANAAFTVLASGTVEGYKWQVSKNNGTSFSDVSDETFIGYSGANSATLAITKPTVAMSNYRYRVILSACDPIKTTTSNAATLMVGKAAITVIADDKTKTYGAALPELTVSYDGLVNGDTAPATVPSISTTATASSAVGTYPITASGAADDNYNISYEAGTLTVEAVDLVITADDKTKTYGAALPELTVSYDGLVNGDLAPATVPSISTTATASSAVGTYPITASGAADDNYNISYEAGTLTVEAVDLVITADDKTKDYGAALPGLSVSYDGLVNGDLAPATVPSISTTATASSAVGTYPITASGAADANYNISYEAGTLTVEAVDLVITADDKNKDYGAALPGLTMSYAGLVNGDTAPATVPSISTTATASSAVGTYPITASGAADANYNISYEAGTLTVEAVDLVITADDKTKDYGAALPGLTMSYAGLVNGDTAPATVPSISTTATASSAVGTYPITASGAADANYNISYEAGTLTVEAVDLVITADDKTKDYGAALPGLTMSYAGLVNGDTAPATVPSISTTATASSAVGTYPITASGAADDNYNISYEAGTLTVEAVDLVITADDKTKDYGAALPGLTMSYAGLVNGDTAPATVPSISTTATASSAVGTYPITASGAADDNYNISYEAGTLTVEAVDLVITADDKTKDYGAALPGLTMSYAGLVNGDTAPATVPSISTTATASSAVGTYPITASGAADDNYNISYEAGTLTVEAVDLVITADNQEKFCGQTVTFNGTEFTQVGLVNGDAISSATITSVGASSTASGGDSPYKILIGDAQGTGLVNYIISYVPGSLIIKAVTIDASASSNPVRLGTSATLSAQVTPAVAGVNVTFNLSGSNATNLETYFQSYTATTGANGIATVSVPNLPSDVYKVTAVAGGGCSSSEAYLPVYDPNGGFVTGGGWITSLANAMASGATGRANFGFKANYKAGNNNMTEVDGNTNFQFQAGDLHLKSKSHDDMSLVISGAKATYRGVGTVNGAGNHKFLLVAIDGDISGGGGVDKFRIKIYEDNSSTVLYDNQWSADENSNDATVLGGGSIVIHKPKASGKTAEVVEKIAVTASVEPIVEILESMAVAPNPVREEARVRFSLIEDATVVLRVFDFNGREVERLFSGSVRAHEVKEVNFQRRNLMSGVYILKLTTDRGNSYDKQIIVE